MKKHCSRQVDVEGVERLKENGYNPIRLFGTWYLVRNKSKNNTKVSFYKIKNYKKVCKHEWELIKLAYRCGPYGCTGIRVFRCKNCGKEK